MREGPLMDGDVRVELNGEPRTVGGGTTVADLLRTLGLPAEGVAVELNREVLPRRVHPETPLRDGDAVEIVTFVGGG